MYVQNALSMAENEPPKLIKFDQICLLSENRHWTVELECAISGSPPPGTHCLPHSVSALHRSLLHLAAGPHIGSSAAAASRPGGFEGFRDASEILAKHCSPD